MYSPNAMTLSGSLPAPPRRPRPAISPMSSRNRHSTPRNGSTMNGEIISSPCSPVTMPMRNAPVSISTEELNAISRHKWPLPPAASSLCRLAARHGAASISAVMIAGLSITAATAIR
jgi:hypothetical protein